MGGLIPELLEKDLAELFVHPVAPVTTPPDGGGLMEGHPVGRGRRGGAKGAASKAGRGGGAHKGSSMRARRGGGNAQSSAAGPVLQMQLPHLGDGGQVEVAAQVCVCGGGGGVQGGG